MVRYVSYNLMVLRLLKDLIYSKVGGHMEGERRRRGSSVAEREGELRGHEYQEFHILPRPEARRSVILHRVPDLDLPWHHQSSPRQDARGRIKMNLLR
jgi:hypothetical protein